MTRDEHLLVIAMEECNEIAKRCSKALRFGMEQVQAEAGHAVTGSADESLTNIARIQQEYNDLVAVMNMLGIRVVPRLVTAKREKVEAFLRYSDSLGLVTQEQP